MKFPIFTRSQANDMAIQLARAYTGNHDVIIFEESFHGGLSTGADMSAKVFMNVLFTYTVHYSLIIDAMNGERREKWE